MQGAKSADPLHCTLAAMVFNAIGRADSQPFLARLLKDTDADLRLAAAGALMQLTQRQ